MKTRPRFPLLLGLFVGLLAPAAAAATSGDNGSHDPSRMIESNGKVYVYSTGGGAKSSSDGLSWKSEPAPPWDRTLLPSNQGIWAPDGLFVDGQYLLFGSMWNDSKASAVVVLSSPTLDPSAPNYHFTDHGVSIAGPAGATHSVIDPAPILDADGKLWLVWGGGYPFPTTANSIFLTRLDNATGLPLQSDPAYKPPDSPGYALEQGHKEGPYIHLHAGSYFLFYQTGSCCSGASSSYTIHVARASAVTGPYTGDRTFYAGKSGVHGPGHMGVYSQCGVERFTYHYYPDSGGSVIGENELTWSADGWPTVGAEATTALKVCDANGGAEIGGGSSASGGGTGGSGGASGSGTAGSDAGGSAGSAVATPSGGTDPGGLAGGGSTSIGVAGSGGGATLDGTAVGGSMSGSQTAAAATPSAASGADAGCAFHVAGRVGTEPRALGLVLLLAFARRRRRRFPVAAASS